MLDFTEVLPELYVGSCPSSLIDLKQIRLLGLTGIFNLQTDADFKKRNIDWPKLEQSSYDLDLVIQRKPITDFDDEDLKKNLVEAVDMLYRLLAVGHKIYLHCTAGKERAPTTAIAYLVRYREMSVEEAAELLQNARNCNPKLHIIEELFNLDCGSVA